MLGADAGKGGKQAAEPGKGQKTREQQRQAEASQDDDMVKYDRYT